MPPEMKRQNAFFEEQEAFKEIACRICYQSEACGEWKQVTCQCSIIHDYYLAHDFCLRRLRKCKVCSTPYIIQKQVPTLLSRLNYTSNAIKNLSQPTCDILYKLRYTVFTLIAAGISILLLLDMFNCTTLTKIDQNDLPNLTTEYLWLPIFDVKCFQNTHTFTIMSLFFNFYFLIAVCITLFVYLTTFFTK